MVCEPEKYEEMHVTFDVALNEPNVVVRKPIIWTLRFLYDKVDALILSFKDDLV